MQPTRPLFTFQYARPVSRAWRVCETPPAEKKQEPPPKPKFTDLLKDDEYQHELNTIIEERLARERKKFGNVDADREELERLRKEADARERKRKEEQGNYESALADREKEIEKERNKWKEREGGLLSEIKHDRCTSQLIAVASSLGAIKPEQIARLLGDRVDLDDDRKVVVLDEDRKPMRFAGKPVTIKDLVEKFKEEEPHLFKAENSGEGSGSKGGNETSDSKGEAKTDLDALETAYREAHAAAAKNPGDMGLVSAAREARKAWEEAKKAAKDKKKSAA